MFEVVLSLADGTATEIASSWERVLEENRPYLERGDTVKVFNAEGDRIYFERIR